LNKGGYIGRSKSMSERQRGDSIVFEFATRPYLSLFPPENK